ncbi:MAG: TerC family protein [Myxococcales bacterium]|nr:TerC family protein [Myxococcales bacterium]
MDIAFLLTPEALVSLVTLTAMEIVLGIDNIVFLSILSTRLPSDQQKRARRIGLVGALGTRLGLLLAISWVMGLTASLFSVFGHGFSGRDLILLGGGLFLIAKSTHEVHSHLDAAEDGAGSKKQGTAAFWPVVAQIVVIDIVFSLDSVITAVGMVPQISIMVIAMVAAIAVMLVAAETISHFVQRHPTIKVLALSFLMLIGVMLVAEGMGQHIDKGYIYFAMAFSLGVELINLRLRRSAPVVLHHQPTLPAEVVPKP